MERKFWIALGMYGILIGVAWFTLGAGSVSIFGSPVQIRLVVVAILGTFVFRAVMARWAENIRRSSGEQAGKL